MALRYIVERHSIDVHIFIVHQFQYFQAIFYVTQSTIRRQQSSIRNAETQQIHKYYTKTHSFNLRGVGLDGIIHSLTDQVSIQRQSNHRIRPLQIWRPIYSSTIAVNNCSAQW